MRINICSSVYHPQIWHLLSICLVAISVLYQSLYNTSGLFDFDNSLNDLMSYSSLLRSNLILCFRIFHVRMSNSSGIYWGFNEFGNINRTSLNDYAPWPLWEQILGIVYYFSISVIGILGRSVLIILLQGPGLLGVSPQPPLLVSREFY